MSKHVKVEVQYLIEVAGEFVVTSHPRTGLVLTDDPSNAHPYDTEEQASWDAGDYGLQEGEFRVAKATMTIAIEIS